MANDNTQIARTIFVSALLPHDRHAPQIRQAEARALAKHVNKTLNICSTRNVQLCTSCIIRYILPSASRTSALLKYLVALSKSFRPRPSDYKITKPMPGYDEFEGLEFVNGQITPPKSAFKRLHLVYLLHNVLAAVHGWFQRRTVPQGFEHLHLHDVLDNLKPCVTRLTQLAACRGEFSADEVSQQLLKLVSQWEKLQTFDSEQISTCTALIASISERPWDKVLAELTAEDERKAADEKKAREEARKWLLPARHGVKDDPDAPWYELPAANGLYMKNTRGFPLRAGAFPRGGFGVKNGGEEASQELQKEVLWLHKEVLHCFDDHTNPEEIQDIDALGNKVWKDPERPTRNYWGFTYDGLEKAKENNKNFRHTAIGYDDIAPLPADPNSMDDVDAAVARARALAGGRGGFDNRGGRGRGGRGSGWRGPPRGGGGNGFHRGGRGGPPGRYY